MHPAHSRDRRQYQQTSSGGARRELSNFHHLPLQEELLPRQNTAETWEKASWEKVGGWKEPHSHFGRSGGSLAGRLTIPTAGSLGKTSPWRQDCTSASTLLEPHLSALPHCTAPAPLCTPGAAPACHLPLHCTAYPLRRGPSAHLTSASGHTAHSLGASSSPHLSPHLSSLPPPPQREEGWVGPASLTASPPSACCCTAVLFATTTPLHHTIPLHMPGRKGHTACLHTSACRKRPLGGVEEASRLTSCHCCLHCHLWEAPQGRGHFCKAFCSALHLSFCQAHFCLGRQAGEALHHSFHLLPHSLFAPHHTSLCLFFAATLALSGHHWGLLCLFLPALWLCTWEETLPGRPASPQEPPLHSLHTLPLPLEGHFPAPPAGALCWAEHSFPSCLCLTLPLCLKKRQKTLISEKKKTGSGSPKTGMSGRKRREMGRWAGVSGKEGGEWREAMKGVGLEVGQAANGGAQEKKKKK